MEDFISRPMRAKSLIVAFFGDVASQHGHTIWLGSLIPAMAHFGLNERQVRTSVFRLVQENWLQATRVGRRSYYQFSEYGLLEYEQAAARIYAIADESWSGDWQLIIPVNVPLVIRDKLFKSLHWQGFRSVASGMFGKPLIGDSTVHETLDGFRVSDKVIVMQATADEWSSDAILKDLVYRNWDLADVATGYRDFLRRFKPVLRWLRSRRQIDSELAYVVRLLLIQDFRRLLLQDTPAPKELLPGNWPGAEARQVTSEVYRLIAESSIDYITEQFEGSNGLLPQVDAGFNHRFKLSGFPQQPVA